MTEQSTKRPFWGDEDDDSIDAHNFMSRCPACGELIDCCQGHGDLGDPTGAAILTAHDNGDHSGCHADGCDEKQENARPFWGGTLWVCTDCMLAAENGELDWKPDCEPWSLIDNDPTIETAHGMRDEDHECGMTHEERMEAIDTAGQCDCEHIDFSWSQCQGCGSQLGGERHAYAYRVI